MTDTVTEYPMILTPAQEQRAALVRGRLQEKLTPTQYRRVALLYGFENGEEKTYREVADEEDRDVRAIHQSWTSAVERLRQDACLVLLWLDTYV